MADTFNVIPSGDESGSPLGEKNQTDYMEQILETMWSYRAEHFQGQDGLFDRAKPSKLRPPVFKRANEAANVLTNPDAPAELNSAVTASLPSEDRHRFFRSMKSSQALAQSVFGNLLCHDKLGALAGLETEDGELAFYRDAPALELATLEYPVTYLGEPHPTSVDFLIAAPTRIAVECKLTEWEVGSCSRPMMEDDDPRYCDGTYRRQAGRRTRCQLSEIGVRYWHEIPRLFKWPADEDHAPCPVRFTYQLVRNVLAACVTPDGQLAADAHALLIYDARNPAFGRDGAGMISWTQLRAALKNPANLRRLSWQSLTAALADDPDLTWLSTALAAKYGLK